MPAKPTWTQLWLIKYHNSMSTSTKPDLAFFWCRSCSSNWYTCRFFAMRCMAWSAGFPACQAGLTQQVNRARSRCVRRPTLQVLGDVVDILSHWDLDPCFFTGAISHHSITCLWACCCSLCLLACMCQRSALSSLKAMTAAVTFSFAAANALHNLRPSQIASSQA